MSRFGGTATRSSVERTGGWATCDTWDNAALLCETRDGDLSFPLRIETKRIAPGEMNTWATEIDGTEGSIALSTKLPKTLRFMDYQRGGRQAWQTLDLGSQSAYPTITGAIFEFGFSDPILQMWAAFLDELARAGARGCGSRSTARRPRRRPRRIGCSPPRSARTRSARWSRLPLPGDTAGAEYGFSRLTGAPVSKIVTLSMTTMSSE